MKDGWERRRLAEVAGVSTGPFGSLLHKSDYVDDGIPLVNPINMVDGVVVPDESKLVDQAMAQRLASYTLKEGDIVVGRRGEIGRCAVIGPRESGWLCGTGSFFLRPSPNISARFLAHLIRSEDYREELRQVSTGTTMQNLSNTALGDLVVVVPPLAEQRRIVGILDKASERIAVARENAEKNLRNARALLESRLRLLFAENADGWVAKRLAEHVHGISTGPFGSLVHKSDYRRGGLPLVNPVNIRGDTIVADDRKTVGRATAERLAGYALREHDVVIARRGEIGRCAVVSRDQAGWFCGTGCFVIRPSERSDPHFLAILLRSQPYREKLDGMAGRATMPSLSNKDLANLVVGLPPMPIQRRIVALHGDLSKESERLAAVYSRKLAALDELKQSLLHQAFCGQL